jgi:hypothetical protein
VIVLGNGPVGGLLMKSAKSFVSVFAASFFALVTAFGCAPSLEKKAIMQQ